MFFSPSSGHPFAWPDTDWDWTPQSCWFAPNGTYWICGSYLWVWLPPGWIGIWTLGLAFTHGFIFSEFPEKPANLPYLKTNWAKSVFHWYDYLAAIFVLSLRTTGVMLWVHALTLLNRLNKILKKLFQPLTQNKYKLESWFYKTDWPEIFYWLHKEKLVLLFIPNAVHIYQIWILMLLSLLNTWTKLFKLWILLKPQSPHFEKH